MWWLNDPSEQKRHRFQPLQPSPEPSADRVLLHQVPMRSNPSRKKLVSTLSPKQLEANQRLLEVASGTPAIRSSKSTSHPSVSLNQVKQQLANLKASLAIRDREQEEDRQQLSRLREALLAAEQTLESRDQQIVELQNALDDQDAQARESTRELAAQQETESAYLQSIAIDSERTITRLQRELEQLRDFQQKQAASHQDQLTQVRREGLADLELSRSELKKAEQRIEDLQADLREMREELEDSTLKRSEQVDEIARLARRNQIAEQLIRQVQQKRHAA